LVTQQETAAFFQVRQFNLFPRAFVVQHRFSSIMMRLARDFL
jgi:hypothetical protein